MLGWANIGLGFLMIPSTVVTLANLPADTPRALEVLAPAINTIFTLPLWVGVTGSLLFGGLGLTLLLTGKAAERRAKATSHGAYYQKSKNADEPQASDAELTYWRQIDEMPVWKAAYLWVGQLPAIDYPEGAPPLVRAIADRMVRDIKKGNLIPVRAQAESPRLLQLASLFANETPFGIVSRDGLLNYANLRNEQPRFLFPDGVMILSN